MTKKRVREITGFLVNAAEKTIEPVTLPFGDGLGPKIVQLVGCKYFECVSLPDDNSAWCDEEGLLHDPQHFTMIHGGYPDPIAGNVLFLGPPDREGNTLSCTASLEFLTRRVFCATVGQTGWQPITVKGTMQ